MFNTGDYIVYGSSGVCRVESIGPHHIPGFDTERLYYQLVPVYGNGTIYAPIDTKVLMRNIMNEDEALKLIENFKEQPENILGKHKLVPKDFYESLLISFDAVDQAQLIKTIYLKNEVTIELGRKMGGIDLRYLKLAEERLYSELAIALQKNKEQIRELVEPMLLDLVQNYLCVKA